MFVCGLNYIGFLLYTLTLECTLVSVKDVGDPLNRRILRGDERGSYKTSEDKRLNGDSADRY